MQIRKRSNYLETLMADRLYEASQIQSRKSVHQNQDTQFQL